MLVSWTRNRRDPVYYNFPNFNIHAKSFADENLKTSCPFEFYAQVDAVPIPEDVMQELEEELQNPTGIHTPPPPQLSLKGLLVSKTCGLLYEISNTEGLRFDLRSVTCPNTELITDLVPSFVRSLLVSLG